MSHGIKKPTVITRKVDAREVRRSTRLNTILQPIKRSRGKDPGTPIPPSGHHLQDQTSPKSLGTSLGRPLKRKRGEEEPHSSPSAQDLLSSKRPRTITRYTAEGRPQEDEKHSRTAITDPLKSWVLNNKWPREYFEPDDQARTELLEHDSWLDEIMAQPPISAVKYAECNGFKYPIPMKKAPGSLRRKQSDSSLTWTSDQQTRESKSNAYRDSRYSMLLAIKGSYMDKSDLGISNTSLSSYKTLLSTDQTIPPDSLFRDDVFEAACRGVQDRNEARIIRSISPFIVPSAEDLATMGATKLKCLIENVNEGWTGSIPVEGPRPQPDYSVGFRRSAFTDEQLHRLDPLVGSVFDTSFFVATYQMYFPFLTCEVKRGTVALDVADRQNAHSMTIAVRGVIELYRAVKREKELNQEILAFSISHDHRTVRIYGHYAIINDEKTTFYRHPIKTIDITNEEGKDKWSAYKFTKSVYDIWMPAHLERICSAIDQLPPGLDFQTLERGSREESEKATGSLQDINSQPSEPYSTASQAGQEDTELIPIIPQSTALDTSAAKGGKQGAAKRAKRNPTRK
ncbi:hypothetical protein EJ05DRAFT_456610 [Pseudovirgaria hyperparasitica]|uniref:DUF7924 domain-containing protein n=1 Tax=Pseudovirgaria hyperparasitica TaxID=470096 RepID=A0A6A6VWC1_9PEZI|nr:uncharacterized protein EJ05DRAFT_456610 [Pseudovirgaria hyperparasitica]KAF2754465.1 hypothetical protein EJ05DRAFT_456610 [Pseudovirgaria hyperparasitica]